jgi:hypothetical protein
MTTGIRSSYAVRRKMKVASAVSAQSAAVPARAPVVVVTSSGGTCQSRERAGAAGPAPSRLSRSWFMASFPLFVAIKSPDAKDNS